MTPNDNWIDLTYSHLRLAANDRSHHRIRTDPQKITTKTVLSIGYRGLCAAGGVARGADTK